MQKKILSYEEMKKKCPKLPYGMGSIVPDVKKQHYVYKKNVGGMRLTAYGKTPKEAMDNMKAREKNVKKSKTETAVSKTLYEDMKNWLLLTKAPELKITSYETLEKTVRNYIGNENIGEMRVSEIDALIIQKHLNMLNESRKLSYSTVKKCHDALHDYFETRTKQGVVARNPMSTVVMIKRENILRERELQASLDEDSESLMFFDDSDLEKFIPEATQLSEDGTPYYPPGICLAANVFIGMRAGELLALRWSDIDLSKHTLHISRNLQRINGNSDSKEAEYIEQSPKTAERTVYLNDDAIMLLKFQKEHTLYDAPSDYVCANTDGHFFTLSGLGYWLKTIDVAAETKIQNKKTHVIRHTAASRFFRCGMPIEYIAEMLGHSVEVCRKTYIHLVEEQMRENTADMYNKFYKSQDSPIKNQMEQHKRGKRR